KKCWNGGRCRKKCKENEKPIGYCRNGKKCCVN
nr:Chain A, Human beta-defensin [Homo sapiens]